MERIGVGDVVRAPRERLTPGIVIALTDYGEVSSLIYSFGRKLSTGEEKLAVKYTGSAQEKVLIDNTDFRNDNRFWGRIKPELALIVPAAKVSTVRSRPLQALSPEGLALLLRYKLKSTGANRIYLVECSFFREVTAPLVWVFAKEREKRDVMEKVIGQRSPGYAQGLREGLDLMFAAP